MGNIDQISLAVDEAHLLDASFYVVFCEHCNRKVMTARDVCSQGELIEICMHCETSITPTQRESGQWVGVRQAIELGYFVDGAQLVEGTDGCGSGGCRGGACGVKQPII